MQDCMLHVFHKAITIIICEKCVGWMVDGQTGLKLESLGILNRAISRFTDIMKSLQY